MCLSVIFTKILYVNNRINIVAVTLYDIFIYTTMMNSYFSVNDSDKGKKRNGRLI